MGGGVTGSLFARQYGAYLSAFQRGEGADALVVETAALRVMDHPGREPGTGFEVWLFTGGRVLAFRATVDEVDALHIDPEAVADVRDVLLDETLKPLTTDPAATGWWRLCFCRDASGKVRYDEYYNRFYASDTSELTLGEVLGQVEAFVGQVSVDESLPLYVFGAQEDCTALLEYVLGKHRSGPVEMLGEVPVPDQEGVVISRQSHCRPGNEVARLRIWHSEDGGVLSQPLHPGMKVQLHLPDDPTFLAQKVTGNRTYADLLPDGERGADFEYLGTRFFCLEMSAEADAFGNAVLSFRDSAGAVRKIFFTTSNFAMTYGKRVS